MAPVSLILSRVGRISWAPADPASPSMIAKARNTDVIAVATHPSTVFLGPVALRDRRSARLHAYGTVEADRLAFGHGQWRPSDLVFAPESQLDARDSTPPQRAPPAHLNCQIACRPEESRQAAGRRMGASRPLADGSLMTNSTGAWSPVTQSSDGSHRSPSRGPPWSPGRAATSSTT